MNALDIWTNFAVDRRNSRKSDAVGQHYAQLRLNEAEADQRRYLSLLKCFLGEMNPLRNASRLIQSLLQCPSQSTWPAEPDLSQLTRWHCLIQGIGDQNLALCLVMDVQTNRWQGTTQVSQILGAENLPMVSLPTKATGLEGILSVHSTRRRWPILTAQGRETDPVPPKALVDIADKDYGGAGGHGLEQLVR